MHIIVLVCILCYPLHPTCKQLAIGAPGLTREVALWLQIYAGQNRNDRHACEERLLGAVADDSEVGPAKRRAQRLHQG
jgi:hypothetical protein